MNSRALIVVDVQNDFCEGGALAVAGGAAVAERISEYVCDNHDKYSFVAFTRDTHNAPPDTNDGHFSENPDYVNSWPVHCVTGTHGYRFHLNVMAAFFHHFDNEMHNVFNKGQGRADYSGFQGLNAHGRSLNDELIRARISDVDVVGIAGEFCVKATAIDAVHLGYRTQIIPSLVASLGGPDATKAVVDEIAKESLL